MRRNAECARVENGTLRRPLSAVHSAFSVSDIRGATYTRGSGHKRNPSCKIDVVKASNSFMASAVATSPALVAFFTEASRLAAVAYERKAARENASVLSLSDDAAPPLIPPTRKPFGILSPRDTWFISAKPQPVLPGIVSINPATARNPLVVQFSPRTRRPRPKLSSSAGE